jgi:hypothetical protein
MYNSWDCLGGEIGRHKGLKIPRLHGRAGSIPALGTKIQDLSSLLGCWGFLLS